MSPPGSTRLRPITTDWDREQRARLAAVQEFAEALPRPYLMCRTLRHSWEPHTAELYPDGGYRETLQCPRCTMLVIYHLDRYGMIVSSYYKPPDGYKAEGLGQLVGAERGMLRLVRLGALEDSSRRRPRDK